MRSTITLLAMFGLLTACSTELDKLNPELRQEAYRAYQLVSQPCEQSSLTELRRVALEPLIAKFTELEKRASNTIAAIDFALAKQIVDQKIADGNKWKCGYSGTPDNKLDFAHEKRWLGAANSNLERLIASGIQKSELPKWLHVANALEFRTLAEAVYSNFDRQCAATVEEEWPSYASARLAMTKVTISLYGSPYEKHLKVAKADTEYLHSVTAVECAEPLSGDAGRASIKEDEVRLLKHIRTLATLAGIAEPPK